VTGTAHGGLGLSGRSVADQIGSLGRTANAQAQEQTHEYFVHQVIQIGFKVKS
jgi:hypothetical protein